MDARARGLTKQQFTLGRLESDRIEETTRQRYLVYRQRAARTRRVRAAGRSMQLAWDAFCVLVHEILTALRLLWRALRS